MSIAGVLQDTESYLSAVPWGLQELPVQSARGGTSLLE